MDKIQRARCTYAAYCTEIGTDAVTEENAILSIGREFLPACALAVLDGYGATVEYYEWLMGQTRQAQDEHDREYAAGHEWHAVADRLAGLESDADALEHDLRVGAVEGKSARAELARLRAEIAALRA